MIFAPELINFGVFIYLKAIYFMNILLENWKHFINEAKLKKLRVFDMDDTLLTTSSMVIVKVLWSRLNVSIIRESENIESLQS